MINCSYALIIHHTLFYFYLHKVYLFICVNIITNNTNAILLKVILLRESMSNVMMSLVEENFHGSNLPILVIYTCISYVCDILSYMAI